jgi:hypothetical protein
MAYADEWRTPFDALLRFGLPDCDDYPDSITENDGLHVAIDA